MLCHPGCIIELDHEGGHRGGGIAKLSGVLNQKILKLSIWGIPYDPKLLITSKTVCQKCQFLKLSIRSKKCQATAFYSPLEKNPGV